MSYFLLLLIPTQLAGAYTLLRSGLRRAPYNWLAWPFLFLWVEAAVFLDRLVVQNI